MKNLNKRRISKK